MRDEVFVDTNILVYSRDASEADKQPRALACLETLWREQRGHISAQVLNEYYVTVTRKLRPGLSVEEARDDVRALWAWHPAGNDGNVMERAWAIQDRYQLSWWDALVVAAAHHQDATILLTEDLQDGLQMDGLTVRNPFLFAPEQLREA